MTYGGNSDIELCNLTKVKNVFSIIYLDLLLGESIMICIVFRKDLAAYYKCPK